MNQDEQYKVIKKEVNGFWSKLLGLLPIRTPHNIIYAILRLIASTFIVYILIYYSADRLQNSIASTYIHKVLINKCIINSDSSKEVYCSYEYKGDTLVFIRKYP